MKILGFLFDKSIESVYTNNIEKLKPFFDNLFLVFLEVKLDYGTEKQKNKLTNVSVRSFVESVAIHWKFCFHMQCCC